MNFTAPDVSVLIVDDNEINLEVTAALLEPLQMKVDMADSGKRALEMMRQKRYDLIFMDHMMPGMDGAETTRRLRQMEDYRSVPVIALTANALKDVQDQFRQAGINGYLPKPVERMALYRCILQWIPRKRILVSQGKKETVGTAAAPAADRAVKDVRVAADRKAGNLGVEGQITFLNAADGIRYTGSEKMWRKLLGDLYRLIDSKSNKLEQCLEDGLIRDYTIEVHALKNTTRMAGAARLSEWFFKMEKCGKAGDVETITKETPELIREFKRLKELLRPYAEENDKNKKEVPVQEWTARLRAVRGAVERFDLDSMDEAMRRLEECRAPAGCGEGMEALRVAMADLKTKDALDAIDSMLAAL